MRQDQCQLSSEAYKKEQENQCFRTKCQFLWSASTRHHGPRSSKEPLSSTKRRADENSSGSGCVGKYAGAAHCKIFKLIWCRENSIDIYAFLRLQKVTDKCFRKCISSPGSSLGSSDQVKIRLKDLDGRITLYEIVSEMPSHVHGSLHGFVQPRFEVVHPTAAT